MNLPLNATALLPWRVARAWHFRWTHFKRRTETSAKQCRAATLAWVLGSQREDGGFSQGFHVPLGKWGPSYPETTGYLIPTLMRCRGERTDVVGSVQRAGEWLLSTQLKNGAFPAGTIGAAPKPPSVFNTGQIVFGLAALARSQPTGPWEAALRKAADWLVRVQDSDGAWRQGLSPFVSAPLRSYHARVAWALVQAGVQCRNPTWIEAGKKNANWVYSVSDADSGWIAHMGFETDRAPLTHCVAYTLRGLIEVAALTGEQHLMDLAVRAGRKIQTIQTAGALPGRLAPGFQSACTASSLAGNAQMALVWLRAHQITGEHPFRQSAERAIRFNSGHQTLGRSGSRMNGGLVGSVPVHRGYGRYWFMSWTQKFHLDSLLALETGETNP